MTRPALPPRIDAPTAACIVGLALFTLAQFLTFVHWDFDDAMIAFRVVRNLIEGQGWTFNPGEHHNPSTSVLNVVGTAVLALTIPSISVAGHLLGAVGLFLAGLAVTSTFRRRVGLVPGAAAGLVVVHVLARNSTWGLETHLFAGLSLLSACLWDARRSPWLVLGLLVLTRPDGLVLVALFAGADWARTGRAPVRGLLQCLAVVAPWAVYSLLTFGQAFPDTLPAKVWQGRSGYWGQGRVYLAALEAQLPHGLSWQWVVWTGAIAGVLELALSRHALVLLAAFAAIQQVAYVLLNVPGYHWYFAFLQTITLVCALFGACSLLSRAMARLRAGDRRIRLVRAAGTAGLVGWSAWMAVSAARGGERVRDVRNEVYRQAMTAIDRQVRETGPLAAVEVGTIGFGTSRKVVDLTGLASANPEFISGVNLDQFFADPPLIVLLHDPPWHFEIALLDDLRFPLLYPIHRQLPDAHFPLQYFLRSPERSTVSAEDVERHINTAIPLPSVVAPTQFTEAVALSGSCALDHVNGRLTANAPLQVAGRTPLRLRGWAVDPLQDTLSEDLLVVLRHESGLRWSVPATRGERKDVAALYPGRSFARAGFAAAMRTGGLPSGRYQVSLVMRSDDGVRECAVVAPIDLRR